MQNVCNSVQFSLRLTLLFLAASAVASPTPAVQGGAINSDGKLEITGLDQWNIKKQPDGGYKLFVKAKEGAKVTANWIESGNKLVASTATIFVTKDWKLVTAEMAGGITYTQVKGPQKVSVSAPKAHYTQKTSTLDVTGDVHLVRTDSSKSESLEAKGTGGTFLISESTDDPLIQADMPGPITFHMRGLRNEDGKKVPFNLNGKAGHLNYLRNERTITLSKGVTLSGTDPSLAGDITGVSRAVITLNKDREIDSIDMVGDPGKWVIDPKKTGGN
jgi:hypothetical protein